MLIVLSICTKGKKQLFYVSHYGKLNDCLRPKVKSNYALSTLCNRITHTHTPVCLIDEQGLISAQGGKKIKKLINAQGIIIIIL